MRNEWSGCPETLNKAKSFSVCSIKKFLYWQVCFLGRTVTSGKASSAEVLQISKKLSKAVSGLSSFNTLSKFEFASSCLNEFWESLLIFLVLNGVFIYFISIFQFFAIVLEKIYAKLKYVTGNVRHAVQAYLSFYMFEFRTDFSKTSLKN